MKYYTMQVHLSATKLNQQDEVIEYRDIDETIISTFWRQIYQQGVKKQTGAKTWEVISPYRIRTVFLIEQDQKYNP